MSDNFRSTILSALVLALVSTGDAFLYAVLPVNAVSMGVPVAWVGILLSVNRFIRLVSNQVFAWLFTLFGFRIITIVAAVFATLSTFVYGFSGTIYAWLSARIIWGLCYSSLRISCIAYSLEGERPGFRLGLSRGLQETGAVLALLVGPFFLSSFGPANTFGFFTLLSIIAITISFNLPELPAVKERYNFSFNPVPSSFNGLVFLSSMLVEGVLVVLIFKLIVNGGKDAVELTATAALYLVYRKLSYIFVSPLVGKIADKFGIGKVFLAGILLTGASIFVILIGYPSTGLILTFTFQGVTSALSPGEAVNNTKEKLKAIATNTTWRDLGAAVGALVGGVLLEVEDPEIYILIFVTGLLLTFANHVITKKQFKAITLWK